MAAFNINRKEVVDISDSRGFPIFKGDPILLRIKGEDIVCRFLSTDGGYFRTETLDGKCGNKYRFGSIEDCKRILGINGYPADREHVTKQNADAGALAPAT